MLKIIRDNTASFLVKILLFIIIIVFVFLGVSSFSSNRNDTAVTVNNVKVSVNDYKQAFEQIKREFKRYYGDNLNDEVIKQLNLKDQALNRLVDQTLVSIEADKLDLRVSDDELSLAILEFGAFQVDGVFNLDQYKRVLAYQRETPESFEADLRRDLLNNKVRTLLMDGIKVSDEELKTWFNWDQANLKVDYVEFKSDLYKDIAPKEEEIKAHFETNSENYKTEPSVKTKYIVFDPASSNYSSDTSVSDDEIKEYFESNLKTFTKEKTVVASHILLKTEKDDDEVKLAEIRKKAEEISKEAKVDGADFAELAKKYSEGPSKDKGGFLGEFKRKDMVKPFADIAFTLPEGSVSGPVKTNFGFHVIKVSKVNEKSTKTLPEVTRKINDTLLAEKTAEKAFDDAYEVYNSIVDDENLDAATGEATVTVVETGFLKIDSKVENVEDSAKFISSAFELALNEIGDIVNLDGKYFIIQLVGKKESVVDEYENVKGRVKFDLVEKIKSEKASGSANEFLTILTSGKTIAEAAKEKKYEVKSSNYFSKTGTIEGIGYDPAMTAEAFKLSPDKITPEKILSYGKDFYVLSFNDKKLPEESEFKKQYETLKSNLLRRKSTAQFNAWISQKRSESEIQINPTVVN